MSTLILPYPSTHPDLCHGKYVAGLFANGEQGAWYDPSDLSTMFQDAAGTIPVTAVGQPVGKILDKSGRGNHATQSTTASRPTLQIDTSGNYYLSFDGIDDWLVTGNINFSATDKMTVFAGSQYFGAAVGILCELSVNGTSNNGAFVAAVNDFSAGRESIAGKVTSVAGAQFISPNNTTRVTTRQVDFAQTTSATEFLMRINGAAKIPASTTPAQAGSGNFGSYPLYIGRRGGTTYPFNGRLYGLIVRGAATDDIYLTHAEKYLAYKSGVSL